MNGWALIAAALLAGVEAVRTVRREPRAGRRSNRQPVLALMARAGRRFTPRLPARLAPSPDSDLLRRTGVQLAPTDVVAARVTAAALFGGLSLVAGLALGGMLGAVAGAAMLAFGCAYPDLWLRAAAARRTARIERAAPALLELVAAGVEAGVPLDAALAGAARAAGGELREELERSRVAIALGRPRGEELRDLSKRTGAPTLAALGLALRLSDRLGVPLAESLRDQADRSRAEAARVVQERAARAGPRVLAVVVFVLVPAALLPIAAAVALTLAGALATHA